MRAASRPGKLRRADRLPHGRLLVLEAVQLANEIEGPGLHLVVNASDILADDADHDQLDTADERRHEDDREPARHEEGSRELRHEGREPEEEREAGDDEAEV